MRIPDATYRFQFNRCFTFKDAAKTLKYLSELGVSDIYASPIFRARPGSMHGYDVVDPTRIEPTLGGLRGFRELLLESSKLGMGWVQDIVPNHMALHSDNAILMDVLENGAASAFFGFFDIDWGSSRGKIRKQLLIPVLGNFYAEELEKGKISITYRKKRFFAEYYDKRFPLCIKSYSHILAVMAERLAENGEHRPSEKISDLSRRFSLCMATPDPLNAQTALRKSFWALLSEKTKFKAVLKQTLSHVNGSVGSPESFDLLDTILKQQNFRLSFWKVATEEINYRRFFSVNELICTRVEKKQVFDHIHKLLSKLLEQKKITGLRVDHIDGLLDPQAYLTRLRKLGHGTWTTVEKILHGPETIPSEWPVDGTTGYDFLEKVTKVLCDARNDKMLMKHYRDFTKQSWDYNETVASNKRLIIGKHLAGDVDNLAQTARNIAAEIRYGRDFTLYGLRRALVEIAAHFPVYRTYITGCKPRSDDEKYMSEAASLASSYQPGLRHEISFLKDLMLFRLEVIEKNKKLAERARELVLRFQQYTGPLMAKGFEDTTLYTFNKLISLNEVGSDPFSLEMTVENFHQFLALRKATCPHTMNSTSTHDTKRGEDARTRINVISEIPDEWRGHVLRWKRFNKNKKQKHGNTAFPDSNDEYFLYQTLLGSYPVHDAGSAEEYRKRLKDYLIKSVREAKRHTAWLEPDEVYEKAYLDFADRILDGDRDNKFLSDFKPFCEKMAFFGMLNSLSQTVIKLTAPGVPDIYQGSELWNFSFVDPDNRRDVSHREHYQLLKNIKALKAPLENSYLKEALRHFEDGRIKLLLVHKVLKFRKEHSRIYSMGDYVPLSVNGRGKDNLIAYARVYKNEWAVTLAGRLYTQLSQPGCSPVGENVWKDTEIELPGDAPLRWENAITGQILENARGNMMSSDSLSELPVAVLHGSTE